MYNILSLWALVLMLAGCAPASRPLTADEQSKIDAMVDRIPMVAEVARLFVKTFTHPYDDSGSPSSADAMADDIDDSLERFRFYAENDQIVVYDDETNRGGEMEGYETPDTSDDQLFYPPLSSTELWHLGTGSHETTHVVTGGHSFEISLEENRYIAGKLTPEEEVEFEAWTIEEHDPSFGNGFAVDFIDTPIARQLAAIDDAIETARDEYEQGAWTHEEALTYALTPPSASAEDFAYCEGWSIDSVYGHVLDAFGTDASALENILATGPIYDYLLRIQDERVHTELSDLFED